ncbi:deoxyribodipyrimidine photolyase-related protein [Flavobacteriaceae bacterium MAR_2010_188]|nr:deoxyribodipyrimidine photolyase-related protein [Flavobacteriaceae bacterium MAR_2010_188]
MPKTLRLILGDQLNSKHSWFKKVDENMLYCMFEMRQETDYVVHHIQKVIGFFAAMRLFSSDLKASGHNIIYYKITSKNNTQSLINNLQDLIERHKISHFEFIQPDEYRLDKQLEKFSQELKISTKTNSSEHFYTERDEVKDFFQGKKQFIMESFYRHMRIKHDVLVHAEQPEGGTWNYDKSNRKKWKGETKVPSYKYFNNKVDDVLGDIYMSGIKTMGNFDTKTFSYPITRLQALVQLKFFCENLLVHFGDFQDALHTDEVYLFHSRLSFALNLKLISPKDVIITVLNYYRQFGDDIHISQVEGFVRQILGWREYMRGMYWMMMPDFKSDNFLENATPLPNFFWSGETKMNCLKNAINNSLDNGYAHHIQRLMITGNFALLINSDPNDVDAWYLGIYVDAVEWVQLPNTRGMSQFADGGKIATKPYVSSGSYINKMSNYCNGCHYNVKEKITKTACPFNSLYWNFLDDKREFLKDNHRMSMMFSLLDNIPASKLEAIKIRAQEIITNPDNF